MMITQGKVLYMDLAEVLKSKIGVRLVLIGRLTRTLAVQRFTAQNFEITPEQFTILSALIENDGMYQRQIAALTYKDRPNITRLLKILEKMELICKQPDVNKRKIYKIFITDKGRKMYEKVLPTILDIWATSLEDVTSEEVDNCLKTLFKIRNNLQKYVKIQS